MPRAHAGPYEQGLELEKQGRGAEARAAFAEAVRAEPANRPARIRLIHVIISGTAPDEAAPMLAREAAAGPADAALLNEQGRLSFIRGRYLEAAGSFSRAVAQDPGFLDASFNHGVTLQRLGKLDEARGAFQKALAVDPSFLRALNALASVETQARRPEEALALVRKAEALSPGDFETLYNAGVIFGEMDRTEEAAGYYRRALAAKPESPEVRNNLGRLLVRLKKYDEAMVELKEAVRLKPDMAEARFNLGILEEEKSRPEAAEPWFQQAVELDPALAEAWFRLGNVVLSRAQGKPGGADTPETKALLVRARECYGRALKVNPGYTEALYNVILVLLQEKRVEEAEVRARELVKVAPNSAPNQFLLGAVETQLGKAAAAEKAYRKAASLDPKCTDCRMRLANLLMQEGQADRAAALYREILKIDPANPDADYLLGLALFRQGELKSARAQMEKVIAAKPDNMEAYNNAATIAFRQRRLKDATIFIGHAIDVDSTCLPIFRTAEMVYGQMEQIDVTGSPKTVSILTNFVVGLRAYNRPESARKAFLRVVEIEPKCTAAHLKLGVIEILAGNNHKALEHLGEAAKLAPADPETRYGIGTAYYNLAMADKRGDKSPYYNDAVAAYREAIKFSPGYADAYWGLGTALYGMGRYREAKEQISMSLKLNPFFAEAYNTIGSVVARQAEMTEDPKAKAALLEEAIKWYQQALRANPNSETSHYNLGVLLHESKKYDEALGELDAALKLNPRFDKALYRKARLYAERRGWFDRGKAEKAFEDLVAMVPGDCEYLYDYGAFYFNTRRYEKARETWRKVLQKCPAHKPARDGIERLIERGY